jgi:hypothetical protein
MNIDHLFDDVRAVLEDALSVSWDGCHKIYLAMDQTEADWFAANYEYTFTGTADEMYDTIVGWWDVSCGLRFVSAVSHVEEDPNAGFKQLISQFADFDDDESDDESDDEIEIYT